MPLLEHLGRTVEEVSELVPACIGLSVSRIDHTEGCTIAVSDEAVAVIEAMRYLEGGPGLDAAVRRRTCEVSLAAPDGRWTFYTAASARAGVRSSLTVPVADNEVTVGAVRVYAGVEHAFEQSVDDVARLVERSEAKELVRGSSAMLTTRRLSPSAPLSLRAQGALNRAIGALTLHLDLDVTVAHERLVDAAQRAGITLDRLALAAVDLHD